MKNRSCKATAVLVILGGARPRTVKISASTDQRKIRQSLRRGEHIAFGEEI